MGPGRPGAVPRFHSVFSVTAGRFMSFLWCLFLNTRICEVFQGGSAETEDELSQTVVRPVQSTSPHLAVASFTSADPLCLLQFPSSAYPRRAPFGGVCAAGACAISFPLPVQPKLIIPPVFQTPQGPPLPMYMFIYTYIKTSKSTSLSALTQLMTFPTVDTEERTSVAHICAAV